MRLTPVEEVIVGTLIARPIATRETMLTALELAHHAWNNTGWLTA